MWRRMEGVCISTHQITGAREQEMPATRQPLTHVVISALINKLKTRSRATRNPSKLSTHTLLLSVGQENVLLLKTLRSCCAPFWWSWMLVFHIPLKLTWGQTDPQTSTLPARSYEENLIIMWLLRMTVVLYMRTFVSHFQFTSPFSCIFYSRWFFSGSYLKYKQGTDFSLTQTH